MQRREGESETRFFARLAAQSKSDSSTPGARSGRKRRNPELVENEQWEERSSEEDSEEEQELSQEGDRRGGVREADLRNDDGSLVEVIIHENGKKKRRKKKEQKPGRKPVDKSKPLDLESDGAKDYWKNYCSAVWVFFDLKDALTSESAKLKLQCRYCQKQIAYDRGNPSTKRLYSHATKHEKVFKAAQEVDFAGRDAYFTLENFRELKNRVEKQRSLFQSSVKMVEDENLVVEWICWVIAANVPLNKFRQKYWKAFKTSAAAKGVILPGEKEMKRLIGTISLLADITACSSIRECGSVSMAIDMWTSITKDHYMGVTYHWIDKDWNLNARVMELYPFFGSATGDIIRQVIEERFDDRFGKSVTLSGMVSDNGSNVKKARTELCPTDSEDCVAHLLHNCIGHVIEKAEKGKASHARFQSSIQADLSAIQGLCVWTRESQSRINELEKAMPSEQKFLKPTHGNKTRWWGKYKMVERLVYLKPAFDRLMEQPEYLEDLKLRLSPPEDFLSEKFWMRVMCYKRIFAILNKLSVKSQREKTETRSRLVTWLSVTHELLMKEMDNLQFQVQKDCWEPFLGSFEAEMLEVTQQSNNSTIAHVLNPRNYELDHTGDKYTPRYLSEQLVEDCWENLAIEATNTVKDKLLLSDIDEDSRAILLGKVDSDVKLEVQLLQIAIRRKAKEVYTQEGPVDFQLCEFMKQQQSICGNLMVGVRAVLCIPVSAAGPERLFSDTGRMITPDRNSLDPWLVSQLARARSFLNDPPPDLRYWDGERSKSRKRHLATISADSLKKLCNGIDVKQALADLEEVGRERDRRRSIDAEELEDSDDEA